MLKFHNNRRCRTATSRTMFQYLPVAMFASLDMDELAEVRFAEQTTGAQ